MSGQEIVTSVMRQTHPAHVGVGHAHLLLISVRTNPCSERHGLLPEVAQPQKAVTWHLGDMRWEPLEHALPPH